MQFIDLQAQRAQISDRIDAAISKVLGHGQFILGPEVQEFERRLGVYCNAPHTLSCANGTDAILLALRAWNIGPGDAVFCPSFTYVATAEVIALLGATPVFIDIDRDTYTSCPHSLEQAISEVKTHGDLTPRAFIAVDLFGQSADYPALTPICRAHGLKIIADSAQALGCRLQGEHPLAFVDVATTSFFPAKPLGCYGDGGAVMMHDTDLAHVIDSLRIHGKGNDKYDNVRIGMNSRLDTLQAAILIEKLAIFDDELVARQNIAERYAEGLKDVALRVPKVIEGGTSTWAIYTIEVPDRDAFVKIMGEAGIPTPAYYPKPTHQQTAYGHYPVSGNGLSRTEDASKTVVALPMHPYLSDADQDRIIDTARRALI